MPNSQFHRLPKATNIIESTTHTSNFQPDNEFLELVCENGQILMQGGGGKSRKDLSFLTSKPKDAVNPKITRFGNLDSDFNNQEQGPPSDHIGLGQDDDMVPWLNYPLGLDDDDDDDTLQHDLGSDFFSELTGVNNNNINMNAFPSHTTNFVPPHFDNNNNNNQMNKDFFSSSSNPTRPPPPSSSRTTPLYSKETSLRPTRLSDFITHQAPSRDSCHTPSPSQQPNTKKDHLQPPTRSSSVHPSTMAGGLMNFSHFSRPAALVKANLQSVTASPNHRGLSSIDRPRSNDKISPASSNPVDSTQIDMTSGSRSGTGFQTPPVSMAGKVNSEPSTDKPSKERLSAEQSRGICREDITRLPDQIVRQSSSFAASTTIGKNVEPLVASSSMCSGSSGPRASNDPKHKSKRKSREADESEYQSEDVEEESGGARKPGNARGGSGAKRSRAAEVHNMSERRRRDRINEKMRALQELIPNCNKVDKASMLDEAIEYLKTLQLQVQIMSMGTGLYMPQMILPPGMQRIPGQHMPHFPPMGVGMGMGMGYGMGMPDMTGNSSMMQMPPMHNMQFPCMPLSGPNNFPAIPGSSLPMFGLPGQGLPTSMASAPYPSPVGLYTKSVPVPEVSGTATPAEVPGRVSSSSLRDATHNMNSHVMQNKNAECSQNQTYQCQATGESFEQSTVAQRNDQTKQVGRTETSKLPTEMGS